MHSAVLRTDSDPWMTDFIHTHSLHSLRQFILRTLGAFLALCIGGHSLPGWWSSTDTHSSNWSNWHMQWKPGQRTLPLPAHYLVLLLATSACSFLLAESALRRIAADRDQTGVEHFFSKLTQHDAVEDLQRALNRGNKSLIYHHIHKSGQVCAALYRWRCVCACRARRCAGHHVCSSADGCGLGQKVTQAYVMCAMKVVVQPVVASELLCQQFCTVDAGGSSMCFALHLAGAKMLSCKDDQLHPATASGYTPHELMEQCNCNGGLRLF